MKILQAIIICTSCFFYVSCLQEKQQFSENINLDSRIEKLLDSLDCHLEYDTVRYVLYSGTYNSVCNQLMCIDNKVSFDNFNYEKQRLIASDIRLNLSVKNPIQLNGDTITFMMASFFNYGKDSVCKCIKTDNFNLPFRVVILKDKLQFLEFENYFGLVWRPLGNWPDRNEYLKKFEYYVLKNKTNVNSWIYKTVKKKYK